MNQEEILNMPAGREMDKLIAEEVFHLEKTNMDGWYWQDGMYDELPYYSIDISDAWKLVEKLCSENGCDVMKVCKRDPELLRGEWSCNFGLGFESFGETAPHAICRAALLARGLTPLAVDGATVAEFCECGISIESHAGVYCIFRPATKA